MARWTLILLLIFLGFLASGEPAARGNNTPTGSSAVIAGDADCDSQVTTRDNQSLLRFILQQPALSQTEPCTDVGTDGWGDWDCDGGLATRDSQVLLRYVLGQPPLSQTEPCPDPGEELGEEQPPSSLHLIEGALASGDLDEETAILYKVFSIFGDSRLPDEYRGEDDDHTPATTVMFELFMQFDSLSAQAQQAMYPFMLPPFAPGSWYSAYSENASSAPAGPEGEVCPKVTPTPTVSPSPGPSATPLPRPTKVEWVPDDTVRGALSTSGKYKVWWPTDKPEWESRARLILQYLDGGIHDAVVGVLGREPLDDSSLTMGDGPAIDIFYLEARIPILGLALPLAWAEKENHGKKTPSAMIINGCYKLFDAGIDFLELTTAHETFHAGHLAFDYASLDSDSQDDKRQWFWLLESASKWFENHRYPNSNHNQYYWDDVFRFPQDSVDDHSREDPTKAGPYSGYVWFLFLTEQLSPSLIREVFENRETMGLWAAMDAAIPGGVQETWPEFVPNLWNEPPADFFEQSDGIPHHARGRTLRIDGHTLDRDSPIRLFVPEGESDNTFTASLTSVNPLAAHFYHFSTENDEGERAALVSFQNPYGDTVPGAVRIQALYKLGGEDQWKLEDWTGMQEKSFCLEDEGQELAELVLIVSNSDWQSWQPSPAFSRPLVTTRDICACPVTTLQSDNTSPPCRFTGSASYASTFEENVPGGWNRSQASSVGTGLVFIRRSEPEPNGDIVYDLASGTLTHESRYEYGNDEIDCVETANGVVQLEPGEAMITLRETGAGMYEYSASGGVNRDVFHVTAACEGDEDYEYDGGAAWFSTGGTHLAPGDFVLQGEDERSVAGATEISTWNFTPQD